MNATHISVPGRRTFFVGLNTGYVDDGTPDLRMIAFYRERCSPLLSCAIIGNVVIPGGHGSNAVTPRITRHPVWRALASAIDRRGSRPGIQLATAWEGYTGARSFRPKNWTEALNQARALTTTISPADLQRLFTQLREGTELAAEAGFRHVQLHAAHGYLFSLLLDTRIYRGADDCLALVANWAQSSREAGLETSLRFSMRTGDERFDQVGTTAFQDEVSASPVDLVDLSSGYYNVDKRLIYPSVAAVLRQRRADTYSLAARHPAKQFIASGRAATTVAALPSNVHIGLCRDLIANPRFLADTARGCLNSGKCHYYSRGADHVTCPRWIE